ARKAAYDQAMLNADQALKDKNYAAAISACREALQQLPDDQRAAAVLKDAEYRDFRDTGRTALTNRRYADAAQALTQAASRRPDDKECRDLLHEAQVQRRMQAMAQGKAAREAKRYPEAVQLFTEAMALASDAEVTGLLAEASFQARLQVGRQRVSA